MQKIVVQYTDSVGTVRTFSTLTNEQLEFMEIMASYLRDACLSFGFAEETVHEFLNPEGLEHADV